MGFLLGPYNSWLEYSEGTEALIHLTHEGYRHVMLYPQTMELLGFSEKEIAADKWKSERAEKERAAGFPTLHAHALLGLWGAFERLVEDIFVAAIVDAPELLEMGKCANLKLPLKVALSAGEDRANAVLREVVRATGSDLKAGINQFENILEYVSLGGPTPDNVITAVFSAQQIRHVWAHRGGVADAKFVDKCPGRAAVGDKLLIDIGEFSRLMHGLHMYGWTIMNRHLRNTGYPPAFKECSGYEGTWDDWR